MAHRRSESSWFVQAIYEAQDESDAHRVFDFMKSQSDYRDGRVLPPNPSKSNWRAQTFHEDCGEDCASGLPDDLHRVLVPPSQQRTLGIEMTR